MICKEKDKGVLSSVERGGRFYMLGKTLQRCREGQGPCFWSASVQTKTKDEKAVRMNSLKLVIPLHVIS